MATGQGDGYHGDGYHGDDDADGEATDRALWSAARMYAGDQAAKVLGISLDEVAPGRATARMRVTGDMTNGHGIAHGGYIFLLADTAFAHACNSYGPVTVAQAVRSPSSGRRARATNSSRRPRSECADGAQRHL